MADNILTDPKDAKKLVLELKKALLKAKSQGVFKADDKQFQALNNSIQSVIGSLNELNESGEDASSAIAKQLGLIASISEKFSRAVDRHYKKVSDQAENYQRRLELFAKSAAEQSLKSRLIIATTGKISEKITDYAEKLTVAYQAQRLFSKIQESARLQQDLLIKSNMGLNVSFRTTSDSSKFAGVGVKELGSEIGETVSSAAILGEALAKAKSSAVLFGASSDEAAEQFKRFSEITGEVGNTKESAAALERLTSASFAVSKALGISASEAADFVATRMEKFGGTADSGAVSLKILYDRAEKINQTFGRTVVRGRDVARAVEDMSRETTTFAFDQRFATDVMTQNMMRLTAMGASYEEAKAKAKGYLDVTMTDKSPEWMQILAGEGLLTGFLKASRKGFDEFNKQFGNELDKAKPGLSKKVFAILEDGTLNMYEKGRLVQELTRGTTTGFMAMNKQILSLYKASGQSLTVLASQMNISREQAYEMVQMAESAIKNEELSVKLTQASANELADALLGDKKTAEEIASIKDKTEKKEAIQRALKIQDEKKLKVTATLTRIQQNKQNLALYKDLKEKMEQNEEAYRSAQSEEDKDYYAEKRKEFQEQMSRVKIQPSMPKEILDESIKNLEKEAASLKAKIDVTTDTTARKKLEDAYREVEDKIKTLKESPAQAKEMRLAAKDIADQTTAATKDLESKTSAAAYLTGDKIMSVLEQLSGPIGTVASLAASFGMMYLGGPTIIAKGIHQAGLVTAIENALKGGPPPPTTGGGGKPGILTGALGKLKGAKTSTKVGLGLLAAGGLAAGAYGAYKYFGEEKPEEREVATTEPNKTRGIDMGTVAGTLASIGGIAAMATPFLKGGGGMFAKMGLKSIPAVGNILTLGSALAGGVSDLSQGQGVGKTLLKTGLRASTALLPAGGGIADEIIAQGFDKLYDKMFASKGPAITTVAGIKPAAALVGGLPSAPSGMALAAAGGEPGLTGSFGALQPDGSVQIVIQNFMNAFGQASKMARDNSGSPTRG
jgi:hypothetical protein